tara:strand:- start:335 stop:751 length:417 start_codon:yes stop_codon:yes gene_type:complete
MKRILKVISAGLFPAMLVMSCTTNETSMKWDGIYRQGFEQNDFYTLDGQGPYWLDLSEASVDLGQFATDAGGRSAHTTVKISFLGQPAETPEFAYSEKYLGQLTAREVLSVASLKDEIYWEMVEAFKADSSAVGAEAE